MAGVLPFDQDGTATTRDGTTVATFRCHVQRDGDSTPAEVGQEYDWRAAADHGALPLVGKRNLLLTVDGAEYRILDAIPREFLPHVTLSLRRVETDG